jgi:ribosomal protein S18 acetylase RimI-like enzyme
MLPAAENQKFHPTDDCLLRQSPSGLRCRKGKFMQSEIATLADAEAVADVVNAAYRGAGGQHGWTHEAELISGARAKASDIATMIGDGATTVLIRRRSESLVLVGCVAVEMDSDNRGAISMLAVSPGLQRIAMGRSLLEDAERFAAEKGATSAKITVVRQRDALIAWYERRGYRRTGKHEAFPYGDDRVGTPLRDDLQFVVLEKAL